MDGVILLDTAAVSVFLKAVRAPHRDKIERVTAELKGNVPAISFITVAEISLWALTANWGSKSVARANELLRSYLILDPTRVTAEIWASLKYECITKGINPGFNDLWVAAAALEYDIPVITSDGDFKDMARIGEIGSLRQLRVISLT